jgi:predicted glycoside hydrolase/deacetylase ChbG (UPF0249 family)
VIGRSAGKFSPELVLRAIRHPGIYNLQFVKRRLIINADDFGLTSGVNRAIVECHLAGTVTSATLMANAHALDAALALAKQNPTLRVGCHVVLIDGQPLTDSKSLRTAEQNAFRTSIADFARHAIRGRFDADEIEAEGLAQMQRLQSAGMELTHFDTHKHTHMFPKVLRPLLRAAKAAGVRAVRNPFAPVKALGWAHLARRPKLWVRYSEVKVLRRFAEQFHCEVKAAGLKTTHGTFGVIVTGALDERLFAAIVGSVPEGTWEFVCHPGYNDAELAKVNTRLRAARESELRVLTSPDSVRLLQSRGVERITFADL